MLLLEVDASLVVAGWLPLILVIVLGLAVAGLFFSMRKHLRRGNHLPTEDEVRAERRAAAKAEASAVADGPGTDA